MPQMMPINWLISFLFFICIFILFNIMNYYIFNLKLNNIKNNKKIYLKNFNWKW
uniref:ATP synthase complex subunit 8 n=1 Tax=Retinia pseudotsugaicola TaxID=1414805 RepID=U5YKB4_9NEOP|nr:ATP synthase F0 subunit 8 [Retinia pseudotsugaicola]AGZ92356.1 ATP synthase F0 subunit 8 [Retinia pseudotsugaicola]